MTLETKQQLLRLRERLKRKKPDFVRYESWRYVRVKENWRRPRGIDNKVRQKWKGWGKMPTVGYGAPRAVRGLHPSGYKEILVYRPEDLDKLDPEEHAIRIAHTVGKKKRKEIVKKAIDMGFKILNPREFIEEEEEEALEFAEQEEISS
ncbi:MAG: 50S ribosomal protein L32e [Candidatus Baldrarchaeia archaeon]